MARAESRLGASAWDVPLLRILTHAELEARERAGRLRDDLLIVRTAQHGDKQDVERALKSLEI